MDGVEAFLDHGWVGSAIGIFGTLVGLIGIAAAVWAYKASQMGARPVYQMRALRLIGVPDSLLAEEVEVRFRGNRIERLTKSRLMEFWQLYRSR